VRVRPEGGGLGACGACEKGRRKEGEERLRREEAREELEGEKAARAGQNFGCVCVCVCCRAPICDDSKTDKKGVAKGRFKGTRWSSGYVCVQNVYTQNEGTTQDTRSKKGR
jgi:hypothetical protein